MRALEAYGKIPLSFEANFGQTDARVKFLARGAGYTVFLTDRDATLKYLIEMDNRVLRSLIEQFSGGPDGLNTLAVAIGEDSGTLEEVYEPFLIQEGFLMRTPRGREVTAKAYEHLGKKPFGRNNTPSLF